MESFNDLLQFLRSLNRTEERLRKTFHPDDCLDTYRTFILSEDDFPEGLTFTDVEEYLRLLCAIFPNYVPVQIELAHLQSSVLNAEEEAIISFNKAVELGKEQLICALVGLAECYIYKGDTSAAKSLLEEILHLDPDNPQIEELGNQIKQGPTPPFGV